MRPIEILSIIVAPAVLLSAHAWAGQQPSQSTSLGGVVTDAKNAQPVSRVVVTAVAVVGTEHSTETDRSGVFTFTNLPPGRYALRFAKPGFVQAEYSHQTFATAAVDDQRLRELKVQLVPTATITGRVFDNNRQPVEGAAVVAVTPTYVNGRRVLLPKDAFTTKYLSPMGVEPPKQPVGAVTNDRGEYRLFDLEPGSYYVAILRLGAEARSFGTGADQSRAIAATYYPGVSDPAQAIALRVDAGADLTGIDLRMERRELHTFRFTVKSPTSPPYDCSIVQPLFQRMKSFVLVQHTPDLDVVHFVSNQERRDFRQIAEDSWVSPELPRGSYDLFFDSCAYAIFGLVGRLRVELPDRDIDAGTLVVSPSMRVDGHMQRSKAPSVSLDRIKVRLRPLDLRSVDFSMVPNSVKDVAVGEDGRFAFTFHYDDTYDAIGTVANGHYQLDLAGLPPDVYVASIQYGGREVRDSGILIEGEPSGVIEVILEEPGGALQGTVEAAQNKPASNSHVVLIPITNDRITSNRFKITTTDQTGSFTMRGIAPGEYRVLAVDKLQGEAFRSQEFLDAFETRATPLTVKAGSVANLTLPLVSR
jgi:uncharacterized protein (DUF2141 family)